MLQVKRQKLATPECLQQQLINSRVIEPRGCNEETEKKERQGKVTKEDQRGERE